VAGFRNWCPDNIVFTGNLSSIYSEDIREQQHYACYNFSNIVALICKLLTNKVTINKFVSVRIADLANLQLACQRNMAVNLDVFENLFFKFISFLTALNAVALVNPSLICCNYRP
jgi:hypothetical protein